MNIQEILVRRAQAFLVLALSDSGYSVTPANIGGVEFYIVGKDKLTYCVILVPAKTLKEARVPAPVVPLEIAYMNMPVHAVGMFGSAKKGTIVLFAPPMLNLPEGPMHQKDCSIETLPKLSNRMPNLSTLDGFNPTREIAFRWSVDDVKTVRPDLLDAEAMRVLGDMYRYCRKERGITIHDAKELADILYEERCLPCTLYPEKATGPVPAILNLATGAVRFEKDIEKGKADEGYTHIEGSTGQVRKIVASVPVQVGEITLAAFGDERFAAEEGYVFDGYEDDLMELTARLAAASALLPLAPN